MSTLDLADTRSPIPLYHQVSSVLRARINDGVYEPGEQIPTEDVLISEFNVSRATIRQAVGQLVQSGLVSRKQGKGTFVLPNVTQHVHQRYRGSRADLVSTTPGSRVRDVSVVHDAMIPTRIANMLGLEQPLATIVRRTREIEGQIYCYSVNYLPAHHGLELTEAELASQSLMGVLESKGVRLGRGITWVRAELVDPSLSEKLQVAFGSPTLGVERLIFDTRGRPIEAIQSWYRSDIYEYTVTIDMDSAGENGSASS